MKDYEKLNLLKHRVMEASGKWSKWNAFAGQAADNLKNFDIYSEVQRQSFIDDLKHAEDTKAQVYEWLKNAQKALEDFENELEGKREKKVRKKKPEPVATPELDVKAEEIELIKEVKAQVNNKFRELMDGKERCPECGEYFTKGGAFYNHYKSHFGNGG